MLVAVEDSAFRVYSNEGCELPGELAQQLLRLGQSGAIERFKSCEVM